MSEQNLPPEVQLRPPDDDLPLPPRPRRPPSRWVTVLISAAGGVGSAWLSRSAGSSVGGSVGSALFMAVFMYAGLRFMTRIRFRLRPVDVDPNERDPAAPPPLGGWASPSATQRATKRLRRLFDNPGRKHRPRR
jgi:hypothetical protein